MIDTHNCWQVIEITPKSDDVKAVDLVWTFFHTWLELIALVIFSKSDKIIYQIVRNNVDEINSKFNSVLL